MNILPANPASGKNSHLNILRTRGKPIRSVGLAISGAVLLVVSYVDNGLPAVIITVFIVCLFAGLWFALPLARRRSRFQ